MQGKSMLGGILIAGASTVQAQPLACNDRWHASSLNGVNGTVYAMVSWDSDGPGPLPPQVVVGGNFTSSVGVQLNGIGLLFPFGWPGWTALGSGVSGHAAASVYSLAVLPNNNLVAGGDFTTAGGNPANFIAVWNGSSWSNLLEGVNSTVKSLAVMSDGTLAAGGAFTLAGTVGVERMAHYFGPATGWGAIGAGSAYPVTALLALPNTNLIAGSSGVGPTFDHLTRWDGVSWAPVGTGIGADVRAVVAMPNGDVVAGGAFTEAGGVPANYIARWNGTSWSPLSTGMNDAVNALAVLPNGELVAGGHFTTAGGIPVGHIALWDGSTWTSLGKGVNNTVHAMAVVPPGNLSVGGSFTEAGGQATSGVATWARPIRCYANCDCSISLPVLNASDFQCWINTFAAGSSYANCDGSTGTPALTANDFMCFMNKYAAGCS